MVNPNFDAFQLTSTSVTAIPARMTAPALMTSTATIARVQRHTRELTVTVRSMQFFVFVKKKNNVLRRYSNLVRALTSYIAIPQLVDYVTDYV